MKTNEIMSATQTRINDFLRQLADDPILGALASPADVQHYLQAGFSALFNAILLQAKSFDAALRTMESLGLGYSRKELEALLSELEREAQAFHQRPLSPDWLIL